MVGEPSNRDYIKVIGSDITTIYGLGNAVTVIIRIAYSCKINFIVEIYRDLRCQIEKSTDKIYGWNKYNRIHNIYQICNQLAKILVAIRT